MAKNLNKNLKLENLNKNLKLVENNDAKTKTDKETEKILYSMAGRQVTAKQICFCKKLIETDNASDSYRHCYSTKNMKENTIRNSASRLRKKEYILATVQHFRDLNRKKHGITVDSLTSELEQARVLALDIDNPSAVIAAIMGKAKLHGLGSEKNINEVHLKMTDEEADEILTIAGVVLIE